MSETSCHRNSKTYSTGEVLTDAFLKSMECGLCHNRFKDPKEVYCGHVFCLGCLLDYVDSQQVSEVKCPLCSIPIRIPSGGIDELTTHVFYQDLAREIHMLENENKLSRGSCKFCSDDEKCLATVKCINCQVCMCENCSSNHKHNGVTNVVPIHRKQDSILCDILPKRDTACDTHPTESLLLYCIGCKCCVCFRCKDERHADHVVTDLADAAAPARTAIADVQSRLNEYLSETKEALNDVERIRKECTDNVNATKKHIEAQVQLLIDRITKEKERMLSEIQEHADEMKARLGKCQTEMQNKYSRAQALSDLNENLLNFGNDAESMQYQIKTESRWDEIQDDKLNRFGQGYKMDIRFFMNEGFLAILSKELGVIRVTQNLCPWTSRKSKPFDITPLNEGLLDASTLQMLKVRATMSNDFSLKRSQIFAKFVDPKWNLETYKTSKTSGQTVTVWLKTDEEQEQMSRASKRISMRSYSSPCMTAEIESFNEKGDPEYKKKFDKLPDGTVVRLAIGRKDTIMLAVYPGMYASSIIGQAKLKSLSKKDVDGIYVAVLEKGNFVCGELRKIPIPEGPGFDFEITSRGSIVVNPALQPNLNIYSSNCAEVVTNHNQHKLSVLKIMESPDGEMVSICRDEEGNTICETIGENGERETRFTFPVDFLSPLICEFKEARFDRNGNVLMHFQTSSFQDALYHVSVKSYRKEYLTKPDMLHKVDKLAVLPDGRLCIFDKAECVLMTLKYL
ncbi:uncharacterized protein LOC123549104 [Mercenaria mercenaria]|uniref:uncharacterized protein LOC123549104 n=1 Tax=Mercenaria mercenaria TaxID=6596 RepID=UPI00234EE048|nr:uncharacterized protein LOC123549104 [Mercenaria mercenaria]